MQLYGTGNEERLIGVLDTSKFDVFTHGIGDRSASVRIPTPVAHANGKGYIEDRRPSSNMDPYIVGAMLADTGILEEKEKKSDELANHYQTWT